jgi:putative ABC transport system permease protein
MNLDEAQEMLDKEGKINAIMALQCLCPGSTIPKAKADIRSILPDTQVKAKQSEALARIQARESAAEKARVALEAEKDNREDLRQERESLAAILVPVVLGASVVWIALMGMANVRDRRGEIALLRAVGLRARHILGLFLSKAVILGILGGILGYLAGFYAGGQLEVELEKAVGDVLQAQTLFEWSTLILAIVLAPCLAAAATWIPAMIAAQQDPADVLREE